MRFRDVSFSREKRFALGQDTTTGGFYLSIPVSNQLVEYEEYYAISKQDFDRFLATKPPPTASPNAVGAASWIAC